MNNIFALLLLILSTFFWGGNFNVGKVVVSSISPLTTASLRFIIASLIIFIILTIKEKNYFSELKKYFFIFFILGCIGIAGTNEFLYFGLKNTSPINTSLIMASYPIVTLILSRFLLQEKLKKSQKIGILVSFIGIFLVITKGSIETIINLRFAKGDFLVIGANICWSLYGVLIKKFLGKVSPLTTTTWTMIFGTIIMTIVANYELLNTNYLEIDSTIYILILYMSIFGTVFAYLFWNMGIAKIGASKTSIFYNLVPFFTVLIAFFLGKEILAVQIIGGLIVIFGVIISSLKK